MTRFLLLFLLFFVGCLPKQVEVLPEGEEKVLTPKESLIRVHIVDQNGLSETITNSEKLKDFAKKDYCSSQPYKKVFRVFEKNPQGITKSIITTYYDNGQVRQYLECLNGRACGVYQEWYSSGQKKARSFLLAGQADLDEKAPLTWSFDGKSLAWDEEGHIIARLFYQKGKLHGPYETFHSNGMKERTSFYENGLLEGEDSLFDTDGTLLEKIVYVHGKREGKAQGFHSGGAPAWNEEYSANRLINGSYFSQQGDLLSSVKEGKGTRSIFDDGTLSSQQEIVDGVPHGSVTIFEKDGSIERTYFIVNGKKEGTEQRFFPNGKPRIQIEWKEGSVHGTVITWYQSGGMQSKKELRGNIKQGLTMAWYPDGSIMLVEEYENDTLKKGRYHKRGETAPVSQVNNGNGIATLFDEDGIVTEKIKYHEGKPQVE